MNELNIYANYNYRRLIKNANRQLNNSRLERRTVFAPKNKGYSIAIYKYNIHIIYDNLEGLQIVKQFVENNIKNKEVVLQYKNNSDDIVNSIRQKNTILNKRYDERI